MSSNWLLCICDETRELNFKIWLFNLEAQGKSIVDSEKSYADILHVFIVVVIIPST